MNQSPDFQSMILALQHFWGERGCLIWQPYYSQVGAGTMNPATFLRVLGPEPWNVAYVEPSVRPDDGRYGDNPYRFQQHTQFQVILKPDPGNPQEVYLQSLQAIGVDPARHDIRFVEDNWESPALGAWGLGWEVWLDGQEITQFTYFQQAGGQVLDPVSVEITYGLERIAMTLQRARHYKDLRWNDAVKFGDLTYLPEFEHSKYYFEVADVDRLRQMYDLYQAECESALAQGLVLPAYDYILKCSHTFNVLDTRGAVGVTERQALFGRMRELSRGVSEVYLQQRQQLEYPWLKDEGSEAKASGGAAAGAALPDVKAPADFLLEIGTEELPPADLDGALAQLAQRVPGWLADLHLAHGEVRVLGTPRRLVLHVQDLAPRQPDRETLVKGPPASKAFSADGAPTPAAVGFARSKGLDISQLKVHEIEGGQYAAALVREAGQPAAAVLADALPGLIAGIKFEKSMRWNASNVAFSRPIRWLLALFGGGVVPFEYAGLRSGATTRGLRFRQPETVKLESAQAYFDFLASEGIRLDPAERRTEIAAQTVNLMHQEGGAERVDDGVLDEVNNLVEAPTAMLGRFDPDRLKLPVEVLVSVMKKYQRYFPVYAADGALKPCFVAVRNGGDQHLEVVADGNEQVIGARFDDANFFIQHDLRQPLADYLPRLGTLVFQKKLGSMLEKSVRIEKLVEQLSGALGMAPDEAAAARRAAALCKADLVTSMVVEMTALQGVMGRTYARHAGESEAVAQAIYEHYLPRFAGDDVPAGKPGLVVGLADRLDTLAGLFCVGLAPSGTKDPFAQRRAALGLVQALIAWDMDFDLRQGLMMAAQQLPVPADEETLAACFEFILGRMRNQFIDAGWRYDVVDSVLAQQGGNPAAAQRAVQALSEWVARADWHEILPAFARCVRITRDQDQTFPVDPAAFAEPEEQELFAALQQAEAHPRRPGDVAGFFSAFLPMIPAINCFFDRVLVMAEDPALRTNRLGLLQRIAALARGIADMSRLEGF